MTTAAPSEIATAVSIYQRNTVMLGKSFDGLTPEEWLRRPGETSNPILWIVGHVVWARSRALAYLGKEWARPWLPLFARGSSLAENAQYPQPEELVSAWQDVTANLTAALESVPSTVLSNPAPEKSPSFDGTVGGMLSFLAFHETYHVGQTAYLRCWLGHSRIVG